MSDCIFCMIVRGEVPAKIVYEDELVLAFDDVSPQAPVHTLVIPKRHVADLGDGLTAEETVALFSAVPKVAKIKGVAESGYRVIINNGPDANQTVRHLHVHIAGGRSMAHGMVTFTEG